MLILPLLLTQAQFRTSEISVDLARSHRISPLVYGINNAANPELPYGCYRFGGNSNTPYNWVNNLSNAGSDYQQSSGLGWPLRFTTKDRWNTPAAGIIHHQETANRIGAESIIQVNVIGYAAADGDGTVTPDQVAPSKRWVEVRPHKGAPFTDNPDPKSPIIYTDSKTGDLHLILISKRRHLRWHPILRLPKRKYRSVEAYGFGTEVGEILKTYPGAKFDGTTFTADLPKLTAVHVVFRSASK